MGVKLRVEKGTKGINSLYLDINHHGRWPKQFLDLKVYANPKTTEERQQNKKIMARAESLRAERENEILNNKLSPGKIANAPVLPHLLKFAADYKLTEKTTAAGMARIWMETKANVMFADLNDNIINSYRATLAEKLTGGSAYNYYSKFKTALYQAYVDKKTDYNIRTFIPERRFKPDPLTLKKEVLSEDEVAHLAKTPCQYPEVKKAFLTTCYTGLAFTDIFNLKFGIHITDGYLKKSRQKTGQQARLPIHPSIIKIMGTGNHGDYVFNLPARQKGITLCRMACMYALAKWVKAAGNKKHITWHSGRHTFGTNIDAEGTVLDQLMGFSPGSNKMHGVYRRYKDERATKAINALKPITI